MRPKYTVSPPALNILKEANAMSKPSPILYRRDIDNTPVFDDTERVKEELSHSWEPKNVVKAEGIRYQEGGQYNLFVLVKRAGGHFTIHHWWFSLENGGKDFTSPWSTNSEKLSRRQYNPDKHLTEQYTPNY